MPKKHSGRPIVARAYSSFNTGKGCTIPSAPRPLWNGSQVLPSRYYPMGPNPATYCPTPVVLHRGSPIPQSKRDTLAMPRTETPGPGYYEKVDVDSHFPSLPQIPSGSPSVTASPTAAGESASMGSRSPAIASSVVSASFTAPTPPRTVSPSKARGWTMGRSPGHQVANDVPQGETGQKINGRVLRTGIPSPQYYSPNYCAAMATPTLHGGPLSKAPRFPVAHRQEPEPGPGSYTPSTAHLAHTPVPSKLYSRHRRLDLTVADYRNLLRESKAPGPGSYNPQLLSSGRTFDLFPVETPGSAFVMSGEKLQATQFPVLS